MRLATAGSLTVTFPFTPDADEEIASPEAEISGEQATTTSELEVPAVPLIPLVTAVTLPLAIKS